MLKIIKQKFRTNDEKHSKILLYLPTTFYGNLCGNCIRSSKEFPKYLGISRMIYRILNFSKFKYLNKERYSYIKSILLNIAPSSFIPSFKEFIEIFKFKKEVSRDLLSNELMGEKSIVNYDNVNNSNINISNQTNKKIFNFNNFNEESDFFDIINGEADPNEDHFKTIDEILFQNRTPQIEQINDIIKRNRAKDHKKCLISLNNNNGVGKSYFVKIMHHYEELKDTFLFPRVEFPEYTTPFKCFSNAILESILIGFQLDLECYYIKNLDIKMEDVNHICSLLNNIIDSMTLKHKKEEKLKKLLDKYFANENQDDNNVVKNIVENIINGKNQLYFRFDEIGNVISNEINFRPFYSKDWRYMFVDLKDTHEKLYSIDQLRSLFSIILKHKNLGVIAAGKNGFSSFMGKSDQSIQAIENINLPPLSSDYIKTILKFEFYRDSQGKFRQSLRKETDRVILENKMIALIDDLFEYTQGHPRMLQFTLQNLMNYSNSRNLVHHELMKEIQIQNEKFRFNFMERYNDEILYKYYNKKMGTDKFSIMKGYELIFLFNFFDSNNIKIDFSTFSEYIAAPDYFGIDDVVCLMNSIGLSYKKEENGLKVLIPKYVKDYLNTYFINKKINYDYTRIFFNAFHKIEETKLKEYLSILSYAHEYFTYNNDIEVIKGSNNSKNYLKNIFNQIKGLKQKKTILFSLPNNYAIDGIVLDPNDEKLIAHFIQVKTGQFQKKQVVESIEKLELYFTPIITGTEEIEKSDETLESFLKGKGFKTLDFTYILLSKEKSETYSEKVKGKKIDLVEKELVNFHEISQPIFVKLDQVCRLIEEQVEMKKNEK